MASTTTFDDWLDEVDPSHYADAYALHEAVDRETSFAQFDVKRAANGALIVSAPGATSLVLISDSAKEAFLRLICGRYVEGGMDIGAWYGMNRGLDSDD
jgi:hypothetical protein